MVHTDTDILGNVVKQARQKSDMTIEKLAELVVVLSIEDSSFVECAHPLINSAAKTNRIISFFIVIAPPTVMNTISYGIHTINK